MSAVVLVDSPSTPHGRLMAARLRTYGPVPAPIWVAPTADFGADLLRRCPAGALVLVPLRFRNLGASAPLVRTTCEALRALATERAVRVLVAFGNRQSNPLASAGLAVGARRSRAPVRCGRRRDGSSGAVGQFASLLLMVRRRVVRFADRGSLVLVTE